MLNLSKSKPLCIIFVFIIWNIILSKETGMCWGKAIKKIMKDSEFTNKVRKENNRFCVSSDTEFELFYNSYLKNMSKQIESSPQEWNWKEPSWIRRCPESQKYVLNLTLDGFLIVEDIYYPPEDFCIEENEKIARVCIPEKVSWRKCCPEGELWDLEDSRCQKSALPFRATINQTFVAFKVHRNGLESHVADLLSCPEGHSLKILTPESCFTDTPQAHSNIINPTDSGACDKCRFQLTQQGIMYEASTGLFHRTKEWKALQNDLYCVEGFFNNSLCYSINSDDNNNLKERCLKSMNDVLFYCEATKTFISEDEVQGKEKAYCLAGIWMSTCPLLVSAGVANLVIIQKNVHGWSLSCYLMSMFMVNINSVILALGNDSASCRVIDFSMKFLYFSTLCWMTSINFGLWRTFRVTVPLRIGPRRFVMNLLFCTIVPAIVVTISFFMGKPKTCGEQNYCPLYSHSTLPYYSGPVIFLILVNLCLFIRTSILISSLRRETSTILQKESKDHLESFRLFTKLFLMTGSIWIIRVLLLFLQLKGLYFTWYGVSLEAIFSIPEAAFSIMILLHPEFKKWAWNKSPYFYRKLSTFFPCLIYQAETNMEMISKSNQSLNNTLTKMSPSESQIKRITRE